MRATLSVYTSPLLHHQSGIEMQLRSWASGAFQAGTRLPLAHRALSHLQRRSHDLTAAATAACAGHCTPLHHLFPIFPHFLSRPSPKGKGKKLVLLSLEEEYTPPPRGWICGMHCVDIPKSSVHGQAPLELGLGAVCLAQEASSWTPILPSARAPDLLSFAATCLQPPLGGSLQTLGGLGQALVKAVGSCAVASCADEADRALLLLGMLCEQLGPDRVRHCHAGQVQGHLWTSLR